MKTAGAVGGVSNREFKNSHDEKTVNRYLVGEIPKDTKKPAEDLPKKPA